MIFVDGFFLRMYVLGSRMMTTTRVPCAKRDLDQVYLANLVEHTPFLSFFQLSSLLRTSWMARMMLLSHLFFAEFR
jgi:hypothetical protein